MKLTLFLLFLLSGCSALENVVSKGGDLNDDALIGAATVFCKAASIGGITRKMTVKEYMELRDILCDKPWAKE